MLNQLRKLLIISHFDENGNLKISGNIDYSLSAKGYVDSVSAKIFNFKLDVDGDSSCVLSSDLQNSYETKDYISIPYNVVVSRACIYKNNLNINADVSVSYQEGGIITTKRDSLKESVSIKPLRDVFSSVNIITDNISSLLKGDVSDFHIQIKQNGVQVNDSDVKKVVVRSSDSSILEVGDNGEFSSKVEYANSAYKNLTLKGVNAGVAKIYIDVYLAYGDGVIIKSYEVSLNVKSSVSNETNQTYIIDTSVNNNMEVASSSQIKIDVKDADGNLVSNEDVKKVTISSLNHLLYFENNSSKFSYEYVNKNSNIVSFNSGEISGKDTLNIEVEMQNGDILNLSKDIVITGGVPSTISLIYVDSTYNDGIFSDRYKVFGVDKYGNRAKGGSLIKVGVVGGVIKDSNSNYLVVDKNGSIGYFDSTLSEFNLTNPNYDFSNVEEGNTVVVLGNDNRNSPIYLGGWIVNSKESNSRLILNNPISNSYNNLSFVVGKSGRYDSCSQQVIGLDFDSESRNYTLDDNGEAYFTLRYPSFYVGKTIFIYANSYNEDNSRVGTSMRVVLKGIGVSFSSDECNNQDGCDIHAKFTINGSGEPLTNVEFQASDFTLDGDCNGTKIIEVNNTSCNGELIFKVADDNQSNDSCRVKWNGVLHYEY